MRGGGLKSVEEGRYSANLLWYRLSDIQGLLLATTHSLKAAEREFNPKTDPHSQARWKHAAKTPSAT
jgi:hypothetical protein